MKKILLVLLFIGAVLSAKSQTRFVYFADSTGHTYISTTSMPLVSIWGNFVNLLNKPTTLAGYGITDGASQTAVCNFLSKTANYTVLSTDFASGHTPVIYLSVDCTGGSITIPFPSASAIPGYEIIVTKTDATANTVTLSSCTFDNIIGVKNSAKEFISDGLTYRQN